MNITDYPQLVQVLEGEQKIVYLCGAGISMALGEHRTSWSAWLERGKDYLTDAEKREFDRIIRPWTADSMIDAAGYLLNALKRSGSYHAFMSNSFCGLSVRQKEMANGFSQIHRAGDFIATTNYDSLLEQAASAGTITYSDPGRILQMLRGEEPRQIIHLHGAYDPTHGIDDIIADKAQYQDIVANSGAQFIQNLIGTHPMIILGCGATVDDPNLSGFLAFAAKHLRLDIPYFYVYKAGDDLSHLPGNMIPVCYGGDYSDLPVFLEDLAAYRLRHRRILRAITRVFPYAKTKGVSSAFGRLHFSNEFSPFVGRRQELASLNAFCSRPEQISWWAVTGEGGMGKSRLLLQWLRQLPSDWYGFFADPGAPAERYLELKPFTNTAIVLDYILGREAQCAQIIQNLLQVFGAGSCRLRIVLVERHYDPAAENWLKRLTDAMEPGTKLAFQSYEYPGSGHSQPLVLDALRDDEEKSYIGDYLRSYLPAFADAPTTREYLDHLEEKCLQIHQGFHNVLAPKHRRPLFLSVYTELWVYHCGDVPVTGPEQLLEVYLEKEETRWLTRFGGDRQVLYAYQKLLSLACAVDVICISEPMGYLQEEAACLLQFLKSEKRAGKRKVSQSDLFIRQKRGEPSAADAKSTIERILYDEDISPEIRYGYAWSMMKIMPDPSDADKAPKQYWLLQPEYPDILRAYIADYYLDEEDPQAFIQCARHISTYEFSSFLPRAIQDFPEKNSFRWMLLTPPEDPNDALEFYTGLLATDIWFDEHLRIQRVLMESARSVQYHFAEMELWRRILIVLAQRDALDPLFDAALRFLSYVHQRLTIPPILEQFPELLDACIIPFHNEKQTDRMESILKKAEEIADASQDECIAGACSEGYLRLLDLRILFDRGQGAGRCWDRIKCLAERFSEDETLADCLAEAGREWGPELAQKRLPKRYRRMAQTVEAAYARHPTAAIAGDLATILANEYFLSYELKKEFEDADQTMTHCAYALEQLYRHFPEEQAVIRAYACVCSDQTFDRCMFSGVCTGEIQPYQAWCEQYPDDREIAESYAKMLYVRYRLHLQQRDPAQAKHCISRLQELAEKFPWQDDDREEQWIHSILHLIRGTPC